jgi:hypothetical protein
VAAGLPAKGPVLANDYDQASTGKA